MSEAICTCHCGGAMFYRHLHAESCILSREGEEAPKSELQTLRDERDRLIKEYVRLFRLCEPIAKMLSELSILPIGCSRETDEQHDSLIRGHRKQLADAQATVEALQARVRELEQWVQDQSTANLETMRHTDEMQSRAMEAEQQLTQRTAELEAAQHDAEVYRKMHAVASMERNILSNERADLQAELERVRGERDKLALCGHDHSTQWWQVRYEELAALVAALPKVEGEIEIYTGKNTNQVVVTYKRGVIIGTLYGLDHAKPVAALYKHRQGMEG